MANEIFKEVPDCKIPKVLIALKLDWPKHFILHQYITIMYDHKTTNENLISQALHCFGNFEEGVYLVETKFKIPPGQLVLYFVYSVSDNLSSMEKALMETHRIPWTTRGYIFEVTMNSFTPVICKVFGAKRLQAVVQHYTLLWIPPETKLNPRNLPDDVCLECLDERHVSEVAKNWPGFPGSDRFVGKEILTNGGLGLFKKSDKRMLSSALIFHSGGIFMLYSDPNYRRKGYAEIVLQRLVQDLRQQGRIPFCTVFSDNIPSQTLVRKIGFVDFGKADYIFPSNFFQNI